MKELDCFRAQKVSSRLCIGGFVSVLLGVTLGQAEVGSTLIFVLVFAGAVALIGGAALGYCYITCPHCGKALYDFPRLPSELPSFCPHCGEKIEGLKAP